MKRARRQSPGFTLIELMIVVAILGVLAVVAGTAYRRYLDNGRTTEAMAMFAEFRAKEEAYRAEFSTYLSTAATEDAYAASNMFPQLINGSEPISKSAIPPTSPVHPWTFLGIQPGRRTLQCSYGVYAGPAGVAPAGGRGQAVIGAAPTTPWWYAYAVCDNDGQGMPNAEFVTGSTTTLVSTFNEHR